MSEIKYGLIHCHSENSIKDSTLTVTELVKTAKVLGAPAITLTDHGTMSGIFELIRASKEVIKDGKVIEPAIKAIPGVEAYIEEDNDMYGRRHLVLLAKNYEGYKAICRAVTASNTRIDGVPRMNKSILMDFFGPDTKGHGNVIATSACVGGVLSTILLDNRNVLKGIEKLKQKQSKYSNPKDPLYMEKSYSVKQLNSQVESLRARRDNLKKLAGKKYTSKERALSRLFGTDEYEPRRKKLDLEIAESQKAGLELAEIKKLLTSTQKKLSAVEQECKALEKSHTNFNNYQYKIDELKMRIRSDDEIYSATINEATYYCRLFGKDNFYIEIQYHGIAEEAETMPKLANIAEELNIQMVAANDVHFAYNNRDCMRARQIVSALRFNKWYPPRSDDSEYYIKTDMELYTCLSKILPKDTIKKAFMGIKSIVDNCNVVFPDDTHFPEFKNESKSETSSQRLRRLVEEGIKRKFPNGFSYRDRVEYELKTIEKMHYTDYLCIVEDFASYSRSLIKNIPEGVGYLVGPGRGSAAGSLVCYLIGITNINPIEYGLIFERFLNPDRVSSPDIDSDFARSIRDIVLQYIKNKYGNDAICYIMTKGTAAGRRAIECVARVRGLELYDDSMYFYELGKEIKKCLPEDETSIMLSDYKSELLNAFQDNEDAIEIINDACLIEGTPLNYGTHAAGIIIADNGDVGEYIPLMWNEENQVWTTQCDMVEAEMQAGLLKFDLLGLKTLDVITDTLRNIKRNKGISVDIESVPFEKNVFSQIFAKGKTDFVFQFESPGMKNMLRRFKPENIHDLVLLVAAYRPGPLQFIDGIIEVKNGVSTPTYICKAVEEILSPTYGAPIFQEQIMALCNKVAGFSMGEADTIRRYMSKKKEKEMALYKPKFIDGLVSQGASFKEAEAFWEQLMKFAQYGFNKSHAASYAVVAYYTAWLKYHYPVEYMTAVMNYNETSRFPQMVKECKALGDKIIAPHINKSEADFDCKDNAIIFGLGKIKNVASNAVSIIEERHNGLFTSYKDFIKRCSPHKDVCEALIDAGALDCWSSNRKAMKYVLPTLQNYLKKITKATVPLETETNDVRISNLKGQIEGYTSAFDTELIPISIPEDKLERLSSESNLLGMYISGHPLDEYALNELGNVQNIVDISKDGQYFNIAGFIKDLRVVKRKKDGKDMAFFILEDTTDKISVCCFAESYAKYQNYINENTVISIFGKITIEISDDNTPEKKIIVDAIRLVEPKQKTLVVTVPDISVWVDEAFPVISRYQNELGRKVVVFFKESSTLRETELLVMPDVLTEEFENTIISEQNL